ncbi:DUF2065 family protein [Roseibium sp. SCP14]|uniref:DUF2065 family protein n=1 Tax=Roseibium sp. SCP14 TaxID=3141375 RepID=UPI0033380B5E
MTETIAIVAGAYLVVTGLGLLISPRSYQSMIQDASSADPILLNLSGMVHFILGMVLLVLHFRFASLLQTMVSVTGILLVSKGAALIVLPDLIRRKPNRMSNTRVISAVGFLIYGFALFTMTALAM